MIDLKGPVSSWAWIAVGIALLISFVADFHNAGQSGAIDLRNRITGVRLLEHGIDPWHYKWSMGDPDVYADVYNNPQLIVSKTTASPALLCLHAPLAALSYAWAKSAWFFGQWFFLVGTGCLWLRQGSRPRHRFFVMLLVTIFTYTASWRLHAERGQAYVLLVFVLAAWMTLAREENRHRLVPFAAGFLAGLLVTLRPTFALLLPFIALHRRGQMMGVVVGLALGIGTPMLLQPPAWTHYAVAMQDNSEYYRDAFDPRPGLRHFPGRIEDISTDDLAAIVPIPFADFSLQALLHSAGLVGFSAWPVLLAWVAPFLVWLWFSRKLSLEILLPAVAAWAFLADLFVPAYRNSYNDVLILDVMAACVCHHDPRAVAGVAGAWLRYPLGGASTPSLLSSRG